MEDLEGNGMSSIETSLLLNGDICEDGRIAGVTEEPSAKKYEMGISKPFVIAMILYKYIHLSVKDSQLTAFSIRCLELADKYAHSKC